MLTIKKRQPSCSLKEAARLSFGFQKQHPWLSDPVFQRVWLFRKCLSNAIFSMRLSERCQAKLVNIRTANLDLPTENQT